EIDVRSAPLYKDGINFIPCSDNVKDVMKIDMNDLKKHMERLAEDFSYDYIILDSAPGLGREALSTLKTCDDIIFITTPTIPNVADVTRCAEVANQLGKKRFNIVLNMVRGKDFELKVDDAQNFFSIPVLGTIPFDENVMDSTAQGIPYLFYRENSKTSDSFMNIAASLIGIECKKKSRFGFLRRIFGR
ncbi:MAG TPA: MinD/ParA family protein, partial [archaeon]|nr:MinD/ParA family protein [archaeon]